MTTNVAKPFLKWAGGKRQLLPLINQHLPIEIQDQMIIRYVEPFIGGGAVFFDLIQKYQFDEIIINDSNTELMHLYKHIKTDVHNLISELRKISNNYLLLNENERADYFYSIRDFFNNSDSGDIKKSAYFIFLNKTCFNGLYRVNMKGKFNVPHGRYKNPLILDEENLLRVSEILANVTIMNGDFTIIEELVDNKTFVYFDPPYKPLSVTSQFTSYVKDIFNDDDQEKLKCFFDRLNSKDAKLLLSNSDPIDIESGMKYFDLLYKDPKYNIYRVEAKRSINSKANGRGKISELLITNY